MKYLKLRSSFNKLPKSYVVDHKQLVLCPDPDIKVAGNEMYVVGVLLQDGMFLRLGLFYAEGMGEIFAESLKPSELERVLKRLGR